MYIFSMTILLLLIIIMIIIIIITITAADPAATARQLDPAVVGLHVRQHLTTILSNTLNE